jgi:hypothetical protein
MAIFLESGSSLTRVIIFFLANGGTAAPGVSPGGRSSVAMRNILFLHVDQKNYFVTAPKSACA